MGGSVVQLEHRIGRVRASVRVRAIVATGLGDAVLVLGRAGVLGGAVLGRAGVLGDAVLVLGRHYLEDSIHALYVAA